MFLKRISLSGFKSFADRIDLDFGAGVTGIVGPNGCGKSNVLDAVRWVLGEQSARSLRGGKMQDVIFAGSRSRKAANSAEVKLTFDNRGGILRSDEQEVVVGRVLYRNGDSEYKLNGRGCRLKDVRELLLDTGVGVDAYSIIEQGRVDSLLQANPVERREIFEEAAGISRYKVRRVEAQRKLDRTQANLLRLQDIIEELEKRLRSVRLAAGKARNFQQYDTRLRELRSSFSMSEYHDLEQGRLKVSAEADALDETLRAERAKLAAHDAGLAEGEHARQALDDEIQAAEGRLLEMQTALSALRERIVQGERRLPELAITRDRRREQAREVGDRLAVLAERIAVEKADLEELRAAEEHSAAHIAELGEARQAAQDRTGEARQRLEQEKGAAFESARRAALLQNDQENLGQQHNRLAAQVERLVARQQEIASDEEGLAGQFGELSARVERLDEQIAELTEALRVDEQRLTELNAEAEELDGQIGELKEQRSAALSRLGVLVDMEQRLEGVDQGTRTVLTWKDDEQSAGVVVGLVADLLNIDDPRVSILQAVLATFEDHVVVRDTEAFLALLSERGAELGPVRVLGLDRVAEQTTPVSYEHAVGFVARVVDWVRCEPEYRALAEHLLGRVYVVRTVEEALNLAAGALAGCMFVTLDGATIGADGRMTFGGAGALAGLISRKAEIRQLRVEIEEIETRLVKLTRRRMEVDEAVSDLQLRRDGLLQRIAATQREHAEARTEQARVADARQRLARETQLVGGELEGVLRSIDEVAGQLGQLEAESATVGAARHEHEERIAALTGECEAAESAITRLTQEYTDAQVERGRAVEKRTAGEESLHEMAARHESLEHARAAAGREADEAAGQIAAAEEELATARSREVESNTACEDCQRETLRLRERRQELRHELEESGAAGRAVQKRIEEVEAELHEQQVALRELEVRKENLVARVSEELSLNLAEMYATYEHCEQDWEAIKSEIEELRGKIARLGNVNLDAIAELDELTPRYEHLVGQREDLTSAIARLEQLIAELDAESRARFTETFEQVRVNFQEMFRKLFGGGKADIILEEPDEPLECGIEIIARPPGKEPQSISLLSGGEKTLTAVALLLAVFKSRPSPFAILDEVDAALDEANIERFNNVLQEFLSHSQFVVITHSKRTMACADVLYGITMEEPGVSKRVSVRFDDRVQAPSVA